MNGLERIRIAGLLTIVAAFGLWGLQSPPDPAEEPSATQNDAGLTAFVASLDQSDSGFTDPWTLSLPRDFGSHPEARSETWSVTAHLETDDGAALSINIVMTRLGSSRSDAVDDRPWEPSPIHAGQAVIVSAAPNLQGFSERVSRAQGTAGHDPALMEVWTDDWTFAYGDDAIDLNLRVANQPLHLSMVPAKEPLALEGDVLETTRGFAIPQLAVTGTWGHGDLAVSLSGSAWLDRLWGDVPLPGGPLVRDRLVLHLSDGTDLSLLRTRRRDGRGIATIDGVLVGPGGEASFANEESVAFAPDDEAASAEPAVWRINGESLDLRVTVGDSVVRDEFGLPVTVNQLDVEGTRDGQTVRGVGTLLLSLDEAS